jgi:hypothetical protein
MMRCFFFLVLFVCCVNAHAQKPIKKKILGTYQGKIEAYKINTGAQFIDVAETPISVDLRKTDLIFQIGRNTMKTDYTWKKQDKNIYLIRFIRDVDQTPEVLILNKKTKEILREGVSPQPNSKLLKVKKKNT